MRSNFKGGHGSQSTQENPPGCASLLPGSPGPFGPATSRHRWRFLGGHFRSVPGCRGWWQELCSGDGAFMRLRHLLRAVCNNQWNQ